MPGQSASQSGIHARLREGTRWITPLKRQSLPPFRAVMVAVVAQAVAMTERQRLPAVDAARQRVEAAQERPVNAHRPNLAHLPNTQLIRRKLAELLPARQPQINI